VTAKVEQRDTVSHVDLIADLNAIMDGIYGHAGAPEERPNQGLSAVEPAPEADET
jgi:hypothetical protein